MNAYRKGVGAIHGNRLGRIPTIRVRPGVDNRVDPNNPGPITDNVRALGRLGFRLLSFQPAPVSEHNGPRPTAGT